MHSVSIVHKIINFFSQIGDFIRTYAKNCRESYYNLLSL